MSLHEVPQAILTFHFNKRSKTLQKKAMADARRSVFV